MQGTEDLCKMHIFSLALNVLKRTTLIHASHPRLLLFSQLVVVLIRKSDDGGEWVAFSADALNVKTRLVVAFENAFYLTSKS